MNENVVEVLIYLYENYMEGELSAPADQQELEDELLQAGFSEGEIEKAFHWMDELVLRQGSQPYQVDADLSMRIYTETEMGRLDVECRGFLLFLEQNGILDPVSRELVIDRATALESAEIGIDELKWITLMVLANHPGGEAAFAQMEVLVYDEATEYLH
jgi:Smg protein